MEVRKARQVRRLKDKKISRFKMGVMKELKLKNNLVKRLQNHRKVIQKQIKMNQKTIKV